MAEETDYSKMKIADLKAELKAKGLPVTGNKQDLIERLKTSKDIDLNDDLLDQDDSMTPEALKEAEKELNVSTGSAPKINRSAVSVNDSKDDSALDDSVLNNTSIAEGKENEPANGIATDAESGVKKAVTSPEVSAEDRLKARAERFGGFQSDEAKKLARAERFGGMVSTGSSNKIGAAPSADLDALKKRAERFGTASSTAMKSAEMSEAIKRRQERFGVVSKDEPKAKIKVPGTVSGNSVVLDEKLKARKERFKL